MSSADSHASSRHACAEEIKGMSSITFERTLVSGEPPGPNGAGSAPDEKRRLSLGLLSLGSMKDLPVLALVGALRALR